MSNCLLADIGGTRARFAVLAGSTIGPVESMMVAAHATAVDAIGHFLRRQEGAEPIDRAVIAAAGPIQDGRCALTNAPWVLESEELKRIFRLATVDLVNDLEAVAWAIPCLAPGDFQAIGHGDEASAGPVALIAPGTGLGMACFVPGRGGGRVLASEGGHATLAATDAREAAIIEALRRRHHGHVSAERVLSGSGLADLYAVLAELDGSRDQPIDAEQITRAASVGSSLRARQCLDAFCSFLGSVAGNAALTFGARGGVFIAGGIVPRIVGHLRGSSFRRQFECKGRFRDYLAGISTKVIVRADPAFPGLRALANRISPMPDGCTGGRHER